MARPVLRGLRAAACAGTIAALATLVALSTLATPAVAGPPGFTFMRLPSLGGTESVALGINDRGHVVGWSATATGARRAVLWRDGAVIDLGAGDGSSANDINDREAVVGAQALSPFIWRQGAVRLLPTMSGIPGGSVSAINDHGTMIGTDDTYVVLWTHAAETRLALPSVLDWGYGINDTGMAVGCSVLIASPGRVAVLFTRAGTVYLPSAVTGMDPAACARGVNDHGQVAGYSWRDSPPYTGYLATRWDDGRPVVLDSPRDARAFAINGAALVVGQVDDGVGGTRAALWVGKRLVYLDRWLDPDLKAAGWVMTAAHAISETGAIAGEMRNASAGETAAWLLVPR